MQYSKSFVKQKYECWMARLRPLQLSHWIVRTNKSPSFCFEYYQSRIAFLFITSRRCLSCSYGFLDKLCNITQINTWSVSSAIKFVHLLLYIYLFFFSRFLFCWRCILIVKHHQYSTRLTSFSLRGNSHRTKNKRIFYCMSMIGGIVTTLYNVSIEVKSRYKECRRRDLDLYRYILI